MKILLFNERFYPDIGGVETLIEILANFLYDIGEEVTVVTNSSPDINESNSHKFEILRSPSRESIRKCIESSDIIHLHSFDAYIFLESILKRKRIITSYHDLSLICPKATKYKKDEPCFNSAGPIVCYKCLVQSNTDSKLKKLIRPLVKSCISVFNDVSIVSNEYQYKRYMLFHKKIIENGIDLNLFKPLDNKNINQTNRVLFIGRLVMEKGCAVLIEAVKICIDNNIKIELIITGSGPEKDNLLRLIAELGIENNVTFTGACYGQELVEVLQNAKILVIPSLMEEIYPLVVLEAFACGIPVISSIVGGLENVVEENCLVFDRGNYIELAEKIKFLLNNDRLQDELSKKSREYVSRKNSSQLMCENIYCTYFNLLYKRRNKNFLTYFIAKLIPFKYKRLLHVYMINKGWPTRIREGNYGIDKLGYKGYVAFEKTYYSTGKLMFLHLLSLGLRPEDTVCDIGCGSFRVGKHLINYLSEGNYLGLEKESMLVESGIKCELDNNIIKNKKPEIIISSNFEFNLFTKTPNIAIAVSLFSHLCREDIILCLGNLAALIKSRNASCKLHTTYFNTEYQVANYKKSHSHLGFFYTENDMLEMGLSTGWHMDTTGAITPSGQRIISYSIASEY